MFTRALLLLLLKTLLCSCASCYLTAAVKQAVKEEVTSAGREVLADVVKDAAIGMHVHLDPTGLSQIIRIGRLVKEGKLGQAAASAVWHAVVGKIVLGALCVVQ